MLVHNKCIQESVENPLANIKYTDKVKAQMLQRDNHGFPLIVGAIIGGTIGGIYAYNEASAAGATGLELTGYTLLGILGGGTIGAFAGGFLGYAFPTVSAFMSTSFPLMTLPTVFGEVIGATTIYVMGSQIVAGGAIITSVLVLS